MTTPALAILHGRTEPARVALFSALPAGDAAPEWIYVMPAADFKLADGRGPYKVGDAAALISRSLTAAARLPIDQDHATEVATKTGAPAPARGWIVALEVRGDAIWGKVEWTAAGRQLLVSREYRGFSPVFSHDDDKRVLRLLRGALTNNPALGERTALFSSEVSGMDWKAKLAEMLGLAETSTDEEVMAALEAKLKGGAEGAPDPAQLSALAVQVGLEKDAKPAAVLTAALAAVGKKADDTARGDKAGGDDEMPAWAKKLEERIETLAGTTAKEKAAALVDDAIKEGRVGVKPSRDRFVSLAAADYEGAKAILAAMPKLGDGNRVVVPEQKGKDGVASLTEDELRVCALMGKDPAEFAKGKAELIAAGVI